MALKDRQKQKQQITGFTLIDRMMMVLVDGATADADIDIQYCFRLYETIDRSKINSIFMPQ